MIPHSAQSLSQFVISHMLLILTYDNIHLFINAIIHKIEGGT